MDKPCRSNAVGGRYWFSVSRISIQRWVRPFVSLLTDREVFDSAKFGLGLWFVAAQFASFVFLDLFFHLCDNPLANRAVFGPILVAFAFFVFLPVFGFAGISAGTLPDLVSIKSSSSSNSPTANRVSCDEWAHFGLWVYPMTFKLVYNALGCFAEHHVALLLRKFRPDGISESNVFGMFV